MKVATFEATVENGQVKIPETIHLPEHTRVYIVVPGVEDFPQFRIASPRLARAEHALDFVKEEVREEPDASVRR